jgi:hypothetical protein
MKNYMELGPAMPGLLRTQTIWTPGDIDGDGRYEVVTLVPANQSLCLLSYFRYGDVAPLWVGRGTDQLINMWSCVQNVPNGWQTDSDDRYYAADLDGDKVQEIVALNATSQQVGVLKWELPQLTTLWQSTTLLSGSWQLFADTQICVADVDGDGSDEILIFNPEATFIGLLKWQNTANPKLTELWSTQSLSLQSIDKFFVGHLDASSGDQQAEIIVYNPTDPTNNNEPSLSMLKWNGAQLVIWGGSTNIADSQWGSPSNPWTIEPDDDQYCSADLDGDGNDEILFFDPSSLSVGVWKYDSSQQVIVFQGLTQDINSAFLHNEVPSSSFCFAADLDGDKADEVVVSYITPNSSNIVVLKWDSSQLTQKNAWWSDSPVGVSPAGVISYFSADVDGDGCDEMIFYLTSQTLMLLKWSNSAVEVIGSWQDSVMSWSVDLLMGAPGTPFTRAPFTGNQQTIYQWISGQLYPSIQNTISQCQACEVDPCHRDDLRSCYKCLHYTDFKSLQSQLNGLMNSEYSAADWDAVTSAMTSDFIYGYISDSLDSGCGADIRQEYTSTTYGKNFSDLYDKLTNQIQPMPGVSRDDWTGVQQQVASELAGVNPVNNWGGTGGIMQYLNTQVENQQTTALSHASTNVNLTVENNGNDTVGYWIAEIMDAAIWGVAALPIGPEVQVPLAALASLFGAYISDAFQQSPSPQQIPFGNFEGQITSAYSATSNKITFYLNTILTDEVLLPVLGTLFNGTPDNMRWTWRLVDAQNIANASLNPDLIQQYRVLIPVRFYFLVWQNVKYSHPYYCQHEDAWGLSMYVAANISPAPPPSALYSEQNSDGTWNHYLLCASVGELVLDGINPPTLDYPGQPLFDDLFNNLSVSKDDFFKSQGVWTTIPQLIITTKNLPCDDH